MELLSRAQSGDQHAFAELTGTYRQELRLHCYRILGSTQDAEDALQETLLGAWQALANFEERASIRTWLYRIATNRCLNMLRSASRRPEVVSSPNAAHPAPTGVGEVVWLEPYPDILLDGLPDNSLDPTLGTRRGSRCRWRSSRSFNCSHRANAWHWCFVTSSVTEPAKRPR